MGKGQVGLDLITLEAVQVRRGLIAVAQRRIVSIIKRRIERYGFLGEAPAIVTEPVRLDRLVGGEVDRASARQHRVVVGLVWFRIAQLVGRVEPGPVGDVRVVVRDVQCRGTVTRRRERVAAEVDHRGVGAGVVIVIRIV
ncbi:hypothetical protein D9M68_703530 [compost metagenome]